MLDRLASAPVRSAERSELGRVVRTLTAAFGEPLRGDAWEWLHDSPHGTVLVAERHGAILGTGSALSFGRTGWIGGIGVEPRERRRGLGTELTARTADWLRDEGAETLLLQATPAGAPVYERLGFEIDGEYCMFAAPALDRPTPLPPGAWPLTDADLVDAFELDRAATAEARAPALRGAWPSGGVAVRDEKGLAGFHLDCAWGAGPTVARDLAAGVLLVDAARRAFGGVRIGVPADNDVARGALRERGCSEISRLQRMRLGAPVSWNPQMVFGVFNPFWG